MTDFIRSAARRTGAILVFAFGGPFALAFVPFATLGALQFGGPAAMYIVAILFPVVIFFVARVSDRGRAVELPCDAQTGLKIKEALEFWAKDELSSGSPVVFSVMIDGLDMIEQRYGREMRLAVLKEAASRLGDQMRDEDLLVRMGPHGFAAGVARASEPTTDMLLSFARRLQKLFDEPVLDSVQRVYCSVSVGITPASALEGVTPAQLLEAAEETGCIALSSGPGAVWVYRAERRMLDSKRADRVEELVAALESKQIVPHFQPQVTTEKGHVVGFEALARWEHPQRGLIPPAEFLPAIQHNGLSQRLTEVILKQSLDCVRKWDEAGYPIQSVSVNFSSEELRNPRLADYVRWELDQNELRPERLVIEVLESVVSDRNEDAISRTLTALSRMGCKIDLDDFGTGFTSIMNIRRFSVSRIKLDRCLVASVDKDDDQQQMVRALLSMGDVLGVEALAEGVETAQERKKLAELNCPLIQGFCVARPMPFTDTLTWLRERKVVRESDPVGMLGLPARGDVAEATAQQHG